MSTTLSTDAARRIALAAQGFTRSQPPSPGTRHFGGLLDRLGILQIDSVNVFARSHYLPVFARLGSYSPGDLDALTHARPASVTEWWGHEATFMRTADLPLWRWKMARLQQRDLADEDSWANTHAGVIEWVRSELAERGPSVAQEIETDAERGRSGWWEWSEVKRALETLFRWGEVATAGRTSTFQRRYALAEQVVPREVRERDVSEGDAVRELVRRAAVRTGVATASDLADYHRLPTALTMTAIHELEEAGELNRVHVDGWRRGGRPLAAWMPSEQRVPRAVDAHAILSPFDPVVWTRDRAERLFDFHYRIEIYTPRHKRVHGYYVLPVLIGDQLVARVDLKNDRAAGVLRVQSAWKQANIGADTVERLTTLLRATAEWQGNEQISVGIRGDFSDAVADALGAPRHETE